MNGRLLISVFAAALTLSGSAFAAAPAKPKNAEKGKPPPKKTAPPVPFNGHSASYDWLLKTHDSNKDGKLDDKERAAVRAAFAQKDFMAGKLDVDANGSLENSEIDRVLNEPVAKPPPPKAKSAPKKPAPKKDPKKK